LPPAQIEWIIHCFTEQGDAVATYLQRQSEQEGWVKLRGEQVMNEWKRLRRFFAHIPTGWEHFKFMAERVEKRKDVMRGFTAQPLRENSFSPPSVSAESHVSDESPSESYEPAAQSCSDTIESCSLSESPVVRKRRRRGSKGRKSRRKRLRKLATQMVQLVGQFIEEVEAYS
jgi:hypothetical protein